MPYRNLNIGIVERFAIRLGCVLLREAEESTVRCQLIAKKLFWQRPEKSFLALERRKGDRIQRRVDYDAFGDNLHLEAIRKLEVVLKWIIEIGQHHGDLCTIECR